MCKSGKERGDAMMRRFPAISIAVLIMFLYPLFGCGAKRKSTLEIPEGYTGIVGCGSLIYLPSMESTLDHKYEGPIHEVHVKGYERVWRCRRWGPEHKAHIIRGTERVPILGAVDLDLSPKKKGRINGILYLLTDEELLKVDERERHYRRVDVTDEIEEFRFTGGKVYVYARLPSSLPASSADKGIYIVHKGYFDLVTTARDSRGTAFREEFDRTTRPCEYEIVPWENIVMPARLYSIWVYYPNITIIYGTVSETDANKKAAERLNNEYLGLNSDVIKPDTAITDNDLITECVVLFGRPETNKITKRFKDSFPIKFKQDNFSYDGIDYTKTSQGLAQIIEHPLQSKGYFILYAGLSPEAMLQLGDLSLYDSPNSFVIYDGDKILCSGDWEVDADLVRMFED